MDMKIVGIIAEYNPFHNGHEFHIAETKRQTSADFVVVVMSGDFTQRGLPAIADKHLRTQMALENGADLVIELPVYYATGSAEYFAGGAVSLLHKLGCITILSFGSEQGDASLLMQAATLLQTESTEFRTLLQAFLKSGNSFPKARELAFSQVFPCLTLEPDFFSSSNNILGIEYCKALLHQKSTISPFTLKRKGAGYLDTSLQDTYPSALGLRTVLGRPTEDFTWGNAKASADTTADFRDRLVMIQNKVPSSVSNLLYSMEPPCFPVGVDDFSSLLHYKLLTACQCDTLTQFADVSKDLAARIKNTLPEYTVFSEYANLLHTKEMTHTRINRSLLHILLDLKKDTLRELVQGDYVYYARILGFRKSASPLLSLMKKTTSIPLISKLADARKVISQYDFSKEEKFQHKTAMTPLADQLLSADILASQIYDAILLNQFGVKQPVEYSKKVIVIP